MIQAAKATVTDVRYYANQTVVMAVQAPQIAQHVKPGQFVMAAPEPAGGIPTPLLKRALAVYGVRTVREPMDTITLLIKVVGDGTRRLVSLRRGDAIDLVGPLGNGFDLSRAHDKINILVVGGTGIASVLLLAESLIRGGEEVHLVYGGRSSEDLVGVADFELQEIPVVTTTEDGSSGIKGLVTDGLNHILAKYPTPIVNLYTCGPNAMMEAVAGLAEARQIPCQISVEIKMACGFGVCLGCTVRTHDGNRLACSDGPVFDALNFTWEGTRRVVSLR